MLKVYHRFSQKCDNLSRMAALTDFPRPNLAVDLVLLTLGQPGTEAAPLRLGVVVQRPKSGADVLPGRFVRERETVAETVSAVLREKLRYDADERLALEMVGVYDAPDRDDRAWVVSVCHSAALRADQVARLSPDDASVLSIRAHAVGGRFTEPLGYDHDEMVGAAVRRARRRYEESPDPLGLLEPPYTLSELRRVHEAVLGEPLKRDTFNRRMSAHLQPARDRRGEERADTGGRPAQLFAPIPAPTQDAAAGPFPLPRASDS